MKRLPLPILLVFALLSPARAEGPAAARQKVAVLALQADTELDAGVVKTLDGVLLAEFHRVPGLEALGSSDISALLKLEEQRTMLKGCTDEACMAEIGGALGVPLLASCSIGAVGKQYVINVRLLDVAEVRVIGRVSETVDRDDSELIAAVKRAVSQVVEQALGRQASGGGGFFRAAPWVTLGLTVAAGGAGAALGTLADKDAADARKEADPDAWRDKRDAAAQKALIADILFGLAGAAAVTTVVLFVVRPDAPETGTRVTLTPALAPTPGGAAAGLTLRF